VLFNEYAIEEINGSGRGTESQYPGSESLTAKSCMETAHRRPTDPAARSYDHDSPPVGLKGRYCCRMERCR